MVDPDKHMRFSGLVKKTHLLSATFFVGFVVAHGGCTPATCPPGYEGPIDNREGQVDPNSDAPYYCLKFGSPAPPPEAPELGKYAHVFPDSPGPRDRNAVAISSVLIESCIHELLNPEFNVNARIDAFYNTTMRSALERAVGDKMTCLSTSEAGVGCERVRNCMGIAITVDEPRFAEGCSDYTAMRRRFAPSGTIYNDWFYCLALRVDGSQLHCHETPFPRCDTWRNKCDPAAFPSCDSNWPHVCEYSPEDNEFFVYERSPSCSQKTTCVIDGATPMCTGTGPSCTETFAIPGDVHLDFRAGIACDDATTLRACVNGHEQAIDCTQLGQGFTCIDGTRPHCGVDFQCGYEGQYPKPTCDGTKIIICNAGQVQSIDCRSLGFETCDPERGVCGNKPATTQN